MPRPSCLWRHERPCHESVHQLQCKCTMRFSRHLVSREGIAILHAWNSWSCCTGQKLVHEMFRCWKNCSYFFHHLGPDLKWWTLQWFLYHPGSFPETLEAPGREDLGLFPANEPLPNTLPTSISTSNRHTAHYSLIHAHWCKRIISWYHYYIL